MAALFELTQPQVLAQANGTGRTTDVAASDLKLEWGWQGAAGLGRWTPVHATFTVHDAGPYHLVIKASDPTGDLVSYVSQSVTLATGPARLNGLFRPGRIGDGFSTELYRDEQLIAQDRIESRGPLPGIQLLRQSIPLIVTLGVPRDSASPDFDAFANTPERQIVRLESATQLPTDVREWDGVSCLFAAGPINVTADQSNGLAQWVRRGGHLILSLPSDGTLYTGSLLSQWIPLQLADTPAVVRDLSPIQAYAGKNVRIPIAQRFDVAALTCADGISLSPTRGPELLMQTPLGLGRVTAIAVDVTRAPLNTWTGLPALVDRLTETTSAPNSQNRPRVNQQLSSTGISDFATQIHAAQDRIPNATGLTPWPALGLIMLLIVLIGPVDYFLVRYVLKRPALTWITLPVLVGLLVAAFVVFGSQSRRTNSYKRLELVDLDCANNTLRGQGWLTIYSPAVRRYDVRLLPDGWQPGRVDPSSISIGWSGIPEASYGGMNRPATLELTQGDYRWGPSPGRLSDVPILQASTRALTYDWSGTSTGFVESSLSSPGIGRLAGSITHHLPATIDDWFLAWSNRVYRLMPDGESGAVAPLGPGETLRLDDRAIQQRELRAFLNQQTAKREHQLGKIGEDVRFEQAAYNPLSDSPSHFMPILSFYAIAGGEKYTTLTNQTWDRLDLSGLMRHHRAVLFGRIPSAAGSVEVNGEVVHEDVAGTFVRIILPVTVIEGELPSLPILVPPRN